MIRNRFPRHRNLQNLHVIPTASSIPLNKNLRVISTSSNVPLNTNLRVIPTASNIPLNTELPSTEPFLSSSTKLPDISNKNIEEKMFDKSKSKNKFNKRRRNRNRKKRQAKCFAATQALMPSSSYHWYNPEYLNQAKYSEPAAEKMEDVESISEIPGEEDFEEVEVASVDADGKQEILVGFRASKLKYLNYVKNCFFRPKIYKFGSERTLVNCLNVQDNCSVDVDVVSEAEYEIECENDNLDPSESQNQVIKTAEINKKQCSTSELEKIPLQGRNRVLEINDKGESSQKTSKSCAEDNADFMQGQCLIQSSLDTWKSHLIGLEYLVEIRDKSKAKYYCVLCSEDLFFEVCPDVNVINHINGHKHIVNYLERHFPSYGFKFDENSDNNVLQKICEEIHEKFGYSSMFITNFEYYKKNELKIKNIIVKASHLNEDDLKLEKHTFLKTVESDTLKDVQDVVDNIVAKILAPEESTMNSESKLTRNIPSKSVKEIDSKALSVLSKDSLNEANKKSLLNKSVIKNKLKSSKSFKKYRANNNISSYLKSKYARAKYKGSKPFKGMFKGPAVANIEPKEKKLIDEETLKIDSTKSGETVSDLVHGDANQKILGSKEKVVQKPTVHSKHCRKRTLGRETTRIKVAAKASTKDEFVSGVLSKPKVKYVSVSESGNHGSAPRVACDKSLKHREIMVISSNKSSPHGKVTSVPNQRISKQDSRSPFTGYSKSPHHRIVRKKETEDSKHEIDAVMMKNSSSHWKAMTRTSGSPVKSPIGSSSLVLKSETKKHSSSPLKKSPVRRTVRRQSKSPVRTIKSPLRLVIRSPVRKFSRSPGKRHSRSPIRRNRSPYQKLSKSPLRRKSRSPHWRHSRSPFRRKSRSPIRRLSRSTLRRHSRSPSRRRSKSPSRRRSKSPSRRRSKSPLRRRSRSPLRRRSRSPLRRRSRSPLRRRSRSPVRRHSRSPVRRCSRSPLRRRSRSPWRRSARDPIKRHSRSPFRRQSRSPVKRLRSPISEHSGNSGLSKSPAREYRSIYKHDTGHSGHDPTRIISGERFSHNVYSYDKPLGEHDREYSKVRSSKILHSFVSNTSDKQKSHTFASGTVRGISDLDPVSDEDESIYFDNQQHMEDSMTSSSNLMLSQLFQKFSIPNVKPDDPSLNKLMLFMEAHRTEIQELLGSQSASKAGKASANKVDPSVQERSLFLQQYLLSNLAGTSQEQGLPSAAVNIQPKYQQLPFLSENVQVGYGPASAVAPHNLPQSNAPRFFPPNVNVPPPEPYRPFSLKFAPKSQVPPEVMFKDLKATVNKLFGANEGPAKQEKNKPVVPGYVTVPDPEKWDFNHPDTQKFNAPTGPHFSGHANPRFNVPVGQKNLFHPQGKPVNFSGAPENSVTRTDPPVMYNNNNNAPGQYFGGTGIDRPQGPNVAIPPPDAKVSFCDVPRGSSKGNLFPVVHNVNSNFNSPGLRGDVSDVKVSLAQRLASVLVKVGMTDVPAPLLQEMLMKIGAFSSLPRQDISEAEIISILKRLGYL